MRHAVCLKLHGRRKDGVNRQRCILVGSSVVAVAAVGGQRLDMAMRDVIEEEGRSFRPASIVSTATGALLSAAILYNAFFGQGQAQRLLADAAVGSLPPGATTRMDVSAGTTVQLKYDPVVEEVQRQLLAAGYYKGAVDGVTGRLTRQAIITYEQQEGLKVDGEASSDLAEHIRYTREIAEASLFTGDVTPAPDADLRAEIRRVQTGLSDLAYDPGEITGAMNDQTHEAIRRFQHDHRIAESGEVSGQLLVALDRAEQLAASTN
jgi:peptidoglycan hydrolase-like protein with peptidoglycan-binding domain